MLLLPPVPDDVIESLPSVFSSIAIFAQKSCEPAGKAYHFYCLQKLGLHSGEINVVEEEVDNDKLDEEMRRKHKERIKKENENLQNQLLAEEDDVDLYEVLGISHLSFSASQQQIKKAYQKMILKHHPDKKNQSSEQDETFLLIQKAWEVLGNETKRRGYDSSFSFDDWIPTGDETFLVETDFYEIYSPVFERNARFSSRKPVPFLGNETTHADKVTDFYNFWSRFDSWREFSKFDEFKDGDIENASGRYERRWMQKQNENIRAKKKKKEYERLMNLVARAQKNDPRLIRIREQEAKEKEEKRKKLEQEKERVEREKREKEEKERIEAERKVREGKEKRIREKKEREKKIEIMENLIEKAHELKIISESEKHKFSSEFNYIKEFGWDLLNDLIKPFVDVSNFKLLIAFNANATVVNETNLKLFLKNLTKANDDLFEERERAQQEKIQNASKAKQTSGQPVKTMENWTPEELSFLAKGVKKFPGGARKRWEQVAEYVNNNASFALGRERKAEDCVQMVKNLAQSKTRTVTKEEAFESFKKKLNQSENEPAANNEEWTDEEQKKLERALREIPATLDKKERWSKISEIVETKSRKQCVDRYKFLREQLLKKK